MSNYGLSDLDFVLYRGYDVTGIVLGLNDEIENPVEEHTVAGVDVAASEFVGTQQGTVDMQGFYDSVLTTALEASIDGADSVLMYALEGNTGGHYVGAVAKALKTSYQRTQEKAGLHKGNVTWSANGDSSVIDRAQLVGILASRSTAGNTDSTYVDAGAQTTGGGRFYVQVPALTLGGYTNVKVQLRHSSDHQSWGDLAAGVATFTGTGALMVAYTGTTYRYRSVAWSWTGSGSGMSTTFAAALATY